jgi:hypothetical protein
MFVVSEMQTVFHIWCVCVCVCVCGFVYGLTPNQIVFISIKLEVTKNLHDCRVVILNSKKNYRNNSCTFFEDLIPHIFSTPCRFRHHVVIVQGSTTCWWLSLTKHAYQIPCYSPQWLRSLEEEQVQRETDRATDRQTDTHVYRIIFFSFKREIVLTHG